MLELLGVKGLNGALFNLIGLEAIIICFNPDVSG